MNPADLRRITARHQRALRHADETRDQLYADIRHAARSGMTVRAIAACVDLSFQRVSQILTSDRQEQ